MMLEFNKSNITTKFSIILYIFYAIIFISLELLKIDITLSMLKIGTLIFGIANVQSIWFHVNNYVKRIEFNENTIKIQTFNSFKSFYSFKKNDLSMKLVNDSLIKFTEIKGNKSFYIRIDKSKNKIHKLELLKQLEKQGFVPAKRSL